VPNERVLVVDDSPETRDVVAYLILANAGYDVLTARDGEDGLILARDLQPDLILSDYLMPGMNGIDLIIALREESLDIPVILMTAEGSEELAVAALRAGARDYLIKPVRAEALLDSVKHVILRDWAKKINERIPEQLLEANRALEARLDEVTMLMNVGTSVTAETDVQHILNQVVDAAVTLTESEEGSLLLLDRFSGELYIRAARNFDQKTVRTLRLPAEDSLAGQVMRTGEPMIINTGDSVKINSSFLIKSMVYVPLRTKNKTIGILSVDNRLQGKTYDNHHLQLLSILADFASVAIENARLYAQTTQERDALDAILRNTDDQVVVIDTEERLIFCNPTALETFHITSSDFLGKSVRDVITNVEVVELLTREADPDRTVRSEVTLGVADSEKVLNAQLTIIAGVGRALVMQDITALKQLDKAKNDFVGQVAHDLRSPLTAVLGYTELLQRAGRLNDQQLKFIDQIIASVHSITGLITELLDLSRIEAGYAVDQEPVCLDLIAKQAAEFLTHSAKVKQQTMLLEIEEGCARVVGNGLRLKQMVMNLLGNAIKYTPEEGTVSMRLWRDSDAIILEVKDTGIGIAVEDQPFVFDKFYRTTRAALEYEGTGLGLAIVKGIVEQHGGRIWLQSKENVGTTFTVVFSHKTAEPAAAEFEETVP